MLARTTLLAPGNPELDLDSRELLDVKPRPFCSGFRALILAGLLLIAGVLVHSKGQWARPKELRELVSLVTKSYQQQIAHPECTDFPQLDLLGVTRNNLANMGPDAGKEGISYHVNTSTGKEMYMDLHAKEAFKADPGDFGLRGSYGTLNVAGHSTANVVVSFRDFKSKQPVVADDFSLSFYDLGFGVEDVSIEGDWSMALVAQDTTVLVHHTEENQRRITFQGTDRSSREDPANPKVLTLNQFNKAITVRFQHTKSFHLSMGVKSALSARVFEFIGYASIPCARNPSGRPLPLGQIYVNEDHLKVMGLVKETNWSWLVVALMIGAILATVMICYFRQKDFEYLSLSLLTSQRKGHGIFVVVLPINGKLGLQLDAPPGIGQPPMIKKILPGAVDDFNKQDTAYSKEFQIEIYDMIVGVGDVTDPDLIMAELKKGLAAETKLALDRPRRIPVQLQGDLGCKLDSLADSYGAIVLEVQDGGSIARWNASNPNKKINKGDRLVSVNGSTFESQKASSKKTPNGGTTNAMSKNSFGSRSQTRLLEEIDGNIDKVMEVEVLKYESFEK